jgi:hypothetical protein
LLCGENWAKAEALVVDGAGGLSELERAVSRRYEEAEIGATLGRQCSVLAMATTGERIRRIAELAARYLGVGGRGDNVRDPEWLSELALRLASDPGGVDAWAEPNLRAGLTRLLDELPALARAARLLVLVTDQHLGSRPATGELYTGWRWK